MTKLIQTLPPGPLDIVGDVHGEAGALRRLLAKLGCDPSKRTAHRPIVFVGDLVDRGPDSTDVVEIVMQLVDAGIAYCVLGNHEFNLLAGLRKEGNGWFFNDPSDHFQFKQRDGIFQKKFDTVIATPQQCQRYLEFFGTLPLALERPDLRVVHACWHAESLSRLPERGNVKSLSAQWSREIFDEQVASGLWAAEKAERQRFGDLKRLDIRPTEDLPNHAQGSEERQRQHPFKVLTSGQETRIPFEDIFFVGGKWRFVRRFDWWTEYDDEPAVIVGHYWRHRSPEAGKTHSAPWRSRHPFAWIGPKKNVFCVDYSAGRRFLERALGASDTFNHGLAALRWPERTLVFDDWSTPRRTLDYRDL